MNKNQCLKYKPRLGRLFCWPQHPNPNHTRSHSCTSWTLHCLTSVNRWQALSWQCPGRLTAQEKAAKRSWLAKHQLEGNPGWKKCSTLFLKAQKTSMLRLKRHYYGLTSLVNKHKTDHLAPASYINWKPTGCLGTCPWPTNASAGAARLVSDHFWSASVSWSPNFPTALGLVLFKTTSHEVSVHVSPITAPWGKVRRLKYLDGWSILANLENTWSPLLKSFVSAWQAIHKPTETGSAQHLDQDFNRIQ